MPSDRHQHRGQGPTVPLTAGCEAIMPPRRGFETAGTFTVTARGAFFISLVVLPLIAIYGAEHTGMVTLAAVCVTAAQSSHLIYRRVHRH